RLPNGEYGLLSWYPSAKALPKSENSTQRKRASAKKQTHGDYVTHGDIRQIVLGFTGNFQSADVDRLVREKLPSKTLSPTAIPTVIFTLRKKQLIKIVSERRG